MNNGQMDRGNENPIQHLPWWLTEAMKKSQSGCLGPGFELGISQIRVQCVTTALPHSVAQFLFRRTDQYYYHHVRFCCQCVKEENLFRNLVDVIKVFDFHFNLEFVLFGVFFVIYLNLVFVIGLFEFEVIVCINSYAFFLDRNSCWNHKFCSVSNDVCTKYSFDNQRFMFDSRYSSFPWRTDSRWPLMCLNGKL